MGGVEGEIHEERLVRILPMGLFNEPDGIVGIRVGRIEPIAVRLEGLVIEAVAVIAFEIVGAAVEVAEITVEAAVHRVAVHVPFADGEGGVSCRAERLPHGDAAFDAEFAVVPVLPAHERRAGRFALGGIEEAGESQTLGREAVEVGRGNFSAVAADVGIAEVIGQNKEDVGLDCGCGLELIRSAKCNQRSHQQDGKRENEVLHGCLSAVGSWLFVWQSRPRYGGRGSG